MNRNLTHLLFLFFTALTFIVGYAFLRYAYRVTDSFPFTQEIVLILLGTVATVLITALLLKQQTAVEIEKEQSIKFMDLKAATYEDLINRIEKMSLAKDLSDADMISMQFLTHRLAIFSSPEVLEEFQKFLEVLHARTMDGRISGDDSVLVSESLANLSFQIRADLIGETDALGHYSREEIKRQILRNSSRSMELSN